MAIANINMHAFELGDFGKLRKTIPMAAKKNIALVAHDHKKDELLEWAKFNRKLLVAHSLYSTGTTGSILTSQLGLDVTNLQSGPLGGDQQIGSRISEDKIDFLIFFWDPLESQPHDPDVKALLRIAVVWNIPLALNRASADFIISSPLMSTPYQRQVPDYSKYTARLDGRGIQGDGFASFDVISEEQIFARDSDIQADTITGASRGLGRFLAKKESSQRFAMALQYAAGAVLGCCLILASCCCAVGHDATLRGVVRVNRKHTSRTKLRFWRNCRKV